MRMWYGRHQDRPDVRILKLNELQNSGRIEQKRKLEPGTCLVFKAVDGTRRMMVKIA